MRIMIDGQVRAASKQERTWPIWQPVAFHGTRSEISAFSLAHADREEGGIFFSSDAHQASAYGDRLVQAKLHTRLPCVVSYEEWLCDALPPVDALRDAGVDMIVITDFDVAPGEAGPTAFCVLSPSIIEIEHAALPSHRRDEALPPSLEEQPADDAPQFLVASFRPETVAFSGDGLAPSLAHLATSLMGAFERPMTLRDINGAVVGEARLTNQVANASPHEYQLVISTANAALRRQQVEAIAGAFSRGEFGSRLVAVPELPIAAAIHAPDWAASIERLSAYGVEVRPQWHIDSDKPTFSVAEAGVTSLLVADDPYEAWLASVAAEQRVDMSVELS